MAAAAATAAALTFVEAAAAAKKKAEEAAAAAKKKQEEEEAAKKKPQSQPQTPAATGQRKSPNLLSNERPTGAPLRYYFGFYNWRSGQRLPVDGGIDDKLVLHAD